MAPPKPTQKGKFRPKKPQKKTSKPATTPSATGAATTTSSSLPSVKYSDPIDTSFIGRNNTAIEPSGGRGSGRGRGGRGRGGRGRGRIPIPQGTVFFTGGEKKTTSASKGSTSKRSTTISAGASRSSKKSDNAAGKEVMDTSTEEVVGQLDTAIGGSGNVKKESKLERDYVDYDGDEGPSQDVGGSINMNISAGCMYDSDSSDEASTRRSKNNPLIAPLELPFSLQSLPQVTQPDVTSSSHVDNQIPEESAQPSSPFVTTDSIGDKRDENNSWFLVQLPTRLPSMQKSVSSTENSTGDTMETDTADQNTTPATNNAMNNISEVAVPPVTTSCFDNELNKNAPGMIGKILVYKSGKTVLVMDGRDGDKVRPMS